jgi:DNA repair exonuclease SbcCD ATPase subunit
MKQLEFSRHNTISSFMPAVALYLLATFTTMAQQAKTPEMQLREKLRATMLQLRTAETERATLQTAQTQCEEEKKTLAARIEEITKQANAYKLAAQPVDGLKAEVASLEKEIARFKTTIENQKQAAELASKKDAERAKLYEEVIIGLERLVADRQAKNLALYKTANEILDRYEKFGLGDALTAREPFTGLTRVKLQNQVQDYQDKILTNRTTLTEKDLAAYRDRLLNAPSTNPTEPAAE